MNWFKNGLALMFDSFVTGFEYIKAEYSMRSLKQPIVTIFGGMHAKIDHAYAQQAFQMGKLLVQNKISVLGGGGPGIMQSANCGAASVHGKKKSERYTLGIGVRGVDDQFHNPCTYVFKARHFYVRKHLLIRYSMGFIVFPGGIGTMDELFEILNLLKHNRIPQVPVILIGKEFWQPLMDWFLKSALKEGLILDQYLTFFSITDDLDDALRQIKAFLDQVPLV